MITVAGVTEEASRIAQLLVRLVTNVVERTILKTYANLISLDPARQDQTDRSYRTKGKSTHRCDIHEVDCCDDSSQNCTNNTDMSDLTEQVQSILSLRYLVDQGISKTYTGTN